MKRGLVVLYKITGILVGLFSYLMLFSCLTALFAKGPQGIIVLCLFVAACMVIYSTLSSLFVRLVLAQKQPMRYSLKDWIKVNAYVSVLFNGLLLFSAVAVLANPSSVAQLLKEHPESIAPYTIDQFWSLIRGLLVVAALVCIHCVWTLRLVKRFRDYFK
jgi:hypothetical protein